MDDHVVCKKQDLERNGLEDAEGIGLEAQYMKAEYQHLWVVWRHGNELGRRPNAKYFNNWLH